MCIEMECFTHNCSSCGRNNGTKSKCDLQCRHNTECHYIPIESKKKSIRKDKISYNRNFIIHSQTL